MPDIISTTFRLEKKRKFALFISDGQIQMDRLLVLSNCFCALLIAFEQSENADYS